MTQEPMTTTANDLPDGWFSPGDIAAYASLYEQVPVRSRVAELGVWQGRSLCSVARSDLGEEPAGPRHRHVSRHARSSSTSCTIATANCASGSRRIWRGSEFPIMSSSTSVRPRASRRTWLQPASIWSLSTPIITTKQCSPISRLPKVKAGRVLCGHDYNRPGHGHAGVKQAVDELIGSDKIMIFPDLLMGALDTLVAAAPSCKFCCGCSPDFTAAYRRNTLLAAPSAVGQYGTERRAWKRSR